MIFRPTVYRYWKVFFAVLAVASAAIFIWPTRYRTVPIVTPRFLAARENRFTGAVDVLTPEGWHRLGPKDTAGDPVAAYLRSYKPVR